MMASGPGYAKHPDHTVTTERAPGTVRITRGGLTLADTDRAIILREKGYDPVAYIPREHVAMDAMEPVSKSTHCPFKGDASYYTITGGGEPITAGAWSYETPFDEVSDIAGHIAFDRQHVAVEGA